MTDNKPVIHVLKVSILWRLFLFGLSAVASHWLAYKPSFPYAELLAASHLPSWLYSWANFDGIHYVWIAEHGYLGWGLVQAFFPVLPLLIAAVHFLTGSESLLVGLVVTNVAFVLMVAVWYKVLVKLTSADIAARWWWIILLFPTSFFWGTLYTEPVYMLFVLTSIWAGLEKKWYLAAGMAALASATRVTGVLLVPALWVEWLLQQDRKQLWPLSFKKVWPVMVLAGGSLGLAAYMGYLQLTFGDPLYFFHVQREFGGGRQESFVLFPQVIWRYIKILWTARPIDWHYYSSVQEVVLAVGALALMVWQWRRVRLSVLVFSLVAWLLPTLTGTFLSMPRFVLACPAVLLAMVWVGEKYLQKTWQRGLVAVLGLVWLAINVTLFIQGYWVA